MALLTLSKHTVKIKKVDYYGCQHSHLKMLNTVFPDNAKGQPGKALRCSLAYSLIDRVNCCLGLFPNFHSLWYNKLLKNKLNLHFGLRDCSINTWTASKTVTEEKWHFLFLWTSSFQQILHFTNFFPLTVRWQ